MNTTDIRRVVLTMDDSDVQRRTENLTRRLTNAKRIKDQLETKAATGQLTKQETRDLKAEIWCKPLKIVRGKMLAETEVVPRA